MANADRPSGFRPHGRVLRITEYQAGGAVYPGDAVKADADGEVVAASASNALLGVAASYAAAQGDAVLVWDHPDQEFVGQADDATVNVQADLNMNYNLLATAADTTYNQSRMEIDASTQATDSTLPLRVMRLAKGPDNALGAQAKLVFTINNHLLKGGTGTEGV